MTKGRGLSGQARSVVEGLTLKRWELGALTAVCALAFFDGTSRYGSAAEHVWSHSQGPGFAPQFRSGRSLHGEALFRYASTTCSYTTMHCWSPRGAMKTCMQLVWILKTHALLRT